MNKILYRGADSDSLWYENMADSAETNSLDAKMCINFYLVWLKAKVIDHCQCLAPSYRHPCV